MTDDGHDLRFGVNVLPEAGRPDTVVGLARLADRAGADLVTFQDHPYQLRRRAHDAGTAGRQRAPGAAAPARRGGRRAGGGDRDRPRDVGGGRAGRLADGWLPSLPALEPGAPAAGNAVIDEAAADAGRDPAPIRRLLNLGGELPAERLAELALDDGVSTFILLTGDPGVVRRYVDETAPRVRALVAEARGA